jgi:hypothetical protein
MRAPTALLGIALAALASSSAEAEGVRASTVSFDNELPGTYELERVSLWVDGALRFDGAAPPALAVESGNHVVSVAAQYRLRDPVFTYVNGYHVVLRSAERVSSAAPHAWVARAVEVGGVTTPVERRAGIVWR